MSSHLLWARSAGNAILPIRSDSTRVRGEQKYAESRARLLKSRQFILISYLVENTIFLICT